MAAYRNLDDMKQSIGQQLSHARKEKKISREQLSRTLAMMECKLSSRQIRALEVDKSVKASLIDLKILFDFLAINTDFVIDQTSDIGLKKQAKLSMKELARRGKEADVVSIFKDALACVEE